MRNIAKSERNLLKTILLCIVLIISFESGLFFFEQKGDLVLSYDWDWLEGGKLPYKIEDCIDLFENNPSKIKVVIIGDSIPEMGFIPPQFDKFFNNKTITYNLCIGGTQISFHSLFIHEIVIKLIKPDIIIWGLDNTDFYDYKNIREQYFLHQGSGGKYYSELNPLSFFDPSVLTLPEILDYFMAKISRIYRFREVIFPNFLKSETFYENQEWISFLNRGHYPSDYNEFQSGLMGYTDKFETTNFYDHGQESFNSNIELFDNMNLSYLIIKSPFSHVIWHYSKLDYLFRSLNSQNFLNLSGLPEFLDDSLFKNENHLNVYGAEIYTHLVCDKINSWGLI